MNETKSDTPRTDKEQKRFDARPGYSVDDVIGAYDFSRQLETELNEARKVADALAQSKKCPNCNDAGWYPMMVHSSNPWEAEQVQCEWCERTPDSRFKAMSAYDQWKARNPDSVKTGD